jgi:hypothetical protein
MQGLTWNPPKYKSVKKLPFHPNRRRNQQPNRRMQQKNRSLPSLLKETGMRCGEAFMLKWTDFNFENRSVDVTPEKGSEPTPTQNLTSTNSHAKQPTQTEEQPFACSHDTSQEPSEDKEAKSHSNSKTTEY